ncbi:homing endonuclease associated repeat-containing protein [Clostridium botulinum]
MRNYNSIDKEDILNIIKTWIIRYKRLPTKQDWEKLRKGNKDIPTINTIIKIFNMSYDEILNLVKTDGAKRSVVVNAREVSDLDKELLKKQYVQDKLKDSRDFKKYNGKFKNEYCLSQEELLEIFSSSSKDIRKSRKELLDVLKDLSKKIGHMPSKKEIENLGYDESIFTRKFATYEQAVLAAKMEMDLENQLKLEAKKIIPKKNRRKKSEYTKEQLKEILIEEYKRSGKKLTFKEIDTDENMPSSSTFKRYFKTTSMMKIWNEILNNDEER